MTQTAWTWQALRAVAPVVPGILSCSVHRLRRQHYNPTPRRVPQSPNATGVLGVQNRIKMFARQMWRDTAIELKCIWYTAGDVGGYHFFRGESRKLPFEEASQLKPGV